MAIKAAGLALVIITTFAGIVWGYSGISHRVDTIETKLPEKAERARFEDFKGSVCDRLDRMDSKLDRIIERL